MITIKQWVEDNGWDTKSEGLGVRVSGLDIPYAQWGDVTIDPNADVELVVPDA